MRVAVLGASPKPERVSNQAVRALKAHGHEVVPVAPGHASVEGIPTHRSLDELAAGSIDTLTLYLGPKHSEPLVDSMIALKPKRVIANPGAESELLEQKLKMAGIDYVEACTLVLLSIGRF